MFLFAGVTGAVVFSVLIHIEYLFKWVVTDCHSMLLRETVWHLCQSDYLSGNMDKHASKTKSHKKGMSPSPLPVIV